MVRDAGIEECFFEDTRLKVGAIEDGDRTRAHPLPQESSYFSGDESCLIIFIIGAEAGDEFTRVVLREEILLLAHRIFRDDVVCRGENRLSRAIVLFEKDDLGSRIVFFELKNVCDRRTAPTINVLVAVAHHANIFLGAGEELDESILDLVGVLVLVDMNVLPACGVVGADFRLGLEEVDGLLEEVVKVEDVGLAEGCFVDSVNAAQGLPEETVGGGLFDVFRGAHVSFVSRDGRLDTARLKLFWVDSRFCHRLLDEFVGVVRIDNRRGSGDSDCLPFFSKDRHAEPVERADEGNPSRTTPHRGVVFQPEESKDALPHLFCGLVGKGNR